MRNYIAAAAILALGASLGHAENAVSNKTESTSVTTTQEQSNQVKPSPELKWTELRGEVERIDLTNNVVQIKEKGTDKMVEVPVTASISIMNSSHHAISLGDLKKGQNVIIRNTQQPS